jgi:hypothetical protein
MATNTGNKGNGNNDDPKQAINPHVLEAIQARLAKGEEPPAVPKEEEPKAEEKPEGATAEGEVPGAEEPIPEETKGEAAPKRKGEKKEDERFLKLSMQTYVDALEKAMGFTKASITLEMAVCMSVYASYGEASLAAKKEVMLVYQNAGYATATHKDADYKTVSRRLNAAAALFDKIGVEQIQDITEGTKEEEHIQAIVNFLSTEFDLKSLNAVWAAAGRPIVATYDSDYDELPARPKRGARGSGVRVATSLSTSERTASGAVPPGTPGTGGVDEQGRPLTKEGTVDQRIKPEGGESLATQVAKGEISKEEADKIAGKQPEEKPEEQPSEADKRMMERVGGAVEAGREERKAEEPVKHNRRKTDAPDVTVIEVGMIHVAIPHNAPYEDIIGVITELMAIASTMEQAGLAEKKPAKKGAGKREPALTH